MPQSVSIPGFRPGFWPTVAAAAVVTVTILLGNWQHRRAEFRAGLQAQAIAASREPVLQLRSAADVSLAMRYRRATAEGVYDADLQIWLDNRTHNGVAGYYVLAPLKLPDGSHVLFNRGWIAATKFRDTTPPAPPPAGVVSVSGRLNTAPPSFLALSNVNVAGAVWQNIDLLQYSRVHQIDIAPLIVEQGGTAADGLVREWPMPDFGRNTNIGYMWQWYSFGALTLVLWIVLGIRAGRRYSGAAKGSGPDSRQPSLATDSATSGASGKAENTRSPISSGSSERIGR